MKPCKSKYKCWVLEEEPSIALSAESLNSDVPDTVV